jgi:hypothetical protein
MIVPVVFIFPLVTLGRDSLLNSLPMTAKQKQFTLQKVTPARH